MNPRTQRQEAALNNLAGLNTARAAAGFAPLSELSQVTFVSDNVFLKGIGEIGRLLQAAQPLHLPASGRYSIELKDGVLHVRAANGIESFEVVDPRGTVKGVRQNSEAITVEIETDAGRAQVVLHRSSSGSRLVESPRTSSPWSYAASEPASESRGGGRCNGER